MGELRACQIFSEAARMAGMNTKALLPFTGAVLAMALVAALPGAPKSAKSGGSAPSVGEPVDLSFGRYFMAKDPEGHYLSVYRFNPPAAPQPETAPAS